LLALLRTFTGVAPGRSTAWTVGLTALSATIGVGYLVTAELLRRRQRSAEDRSDAGTEVRSD